MRQCLLLLLPFLAACSGDGSTPDDGGDDGATDAQTEPQGHCGDVTTWDVTVTGRVRAPDGSAAANATVRIEDRVWSPGTIYGTATTDPSGMFSVLAADIVSVEDCWGTALGYYAVAERDDTYGEYAINSALFTAIDQGTFVADISAVPIELEQADDPVILVVGAGIGGLALASMLAPRSKVVVVDRRERPGLEASAQNAGLVRRLAEDPVDRALAVRTAAWLADPGEEWDTPPSDAVGAVVALARDPTVLADAAAHLRARGVPIEAVADVRPIAPALAGAPLTAAWHLPDERVARSDVLVEGWRRATERAGGVVRCGVDVERLAITAGRVTGVVTRDGTTIGADRVVLAAGAWAGALAARAGLDRPLFPVRRTLVHTAGHPLSQGGHPWWWIDDVGLYGRPDAGGWLLSGCDEHVQDPGAGGSTLPATEAEIARVGAKLARWTPALASATLTGGRSGLRTFTPDRRPLLGADGEADGLWWLAGLGGAGVSGGFAAAEAVAAWMDGRASPVLRHPALVSPGRPTRGGG